MIRWTPRRVTELLALLAFIGCQIGAAWVHPLRDVSWVCLVVWVLA